MHFDIDYEKKGDIDKFLKILNMKLPFPFAGMISSFNICF
jgi:hypothetical protein